MLNNQLSNTRKLREINPWVAPYNIQNTIKIPYVAQDPPCLSPCTSPPAWPFPACLITVHPPWSHGVQKWPTSQTQDICVISFAWNINPRNLYMVDSFLSFKISHLIEILLLQGDFPRLSSLSQAFSPVFFFTLICFFPVTYQHLHFSSTYYWVLLPRIFLVQESFSSVFESP